MLIDWFTVIAQLINFLILVWLLKRFLYKPVLQAMEEREKHIATRLQEAEARKAEAEKERGHYQQLADEVKQQREGLLQQAEDAAGAERRRLLETAREEHRLLRARLSQALDSERANLSRDIIRRFQEEVYAIARKVLSDLADSNLEAQMAAVFARRLEDMEEEERRQLSDALRPANPAVTVHSTFSLAPEQRHAIENALKKLLPPKGQVRFEAGPKQPMNGQAGGIELTAGGYKMSWSIADYLNSLEKSLAGILDEKLESENKTRKHGA